MAAIGLTGVLTTMDIGGVRKYCTSINASNAGATLEALLVVIRGNNALAGVNAVTVLTEVIRKGKQPVATVAGKFRFLNEVIKIVSPKFETTAPKEVQTHLLEALQEWIAILPEQTKIRDAYGMVMAQQAQTQGGGGGGGGAAAASKAGAGGGGALIDFSTPAPKTSSNGGGASAASALASIFGNSQTSLSSLTSLNSNTSDLSHASEMTARYENPLFGGGPQATRHRRSTVEVAPTWHNGYILIDRKQAERLLLSDGLAHGAFLIRESTTAKGTYALAVRDDQEVQHFRIDEEQGLFSIAGSANKFSALQDLVTFYRQEAGVDGAVPIQLRGSQYGYGYYPVGENADAPSQLNPAKPVSVDCAACLKPLAPGESFCKHCGVKPAHLTTSTAAGADGAAGAGAGGASARAASPGPNGGAIGEDEWELERKDLTMGANIGAGNFGEVRLAKLKCPWGATIDVAVKMSKANRMTSQAFLAEAAKMKQLRHTNLVLSYGLCTTEDPIFIVFEYMPGGSLLEHLRTRKGRKTTLQTCVKYMRDIASAMAFMEREHWVHGDLAARNLLLGGKDLVKLCDFGHAVQTNALDDPVHTDQLLPVKWTSPELYNTRGISSKADVWASLNENRKPLPTERICSRTLTGQPTH